METKKHKKGSTRNSLILRIVLVVSVALICTTSMKGQLRYENNHLFIGQKPSQYQPTGSASLCIGPDFSVEFWQGGLNLWRPYPSAYSANYLMFVDQTGRIGIGRKPTTYSLEVNGAVWTTSGVLITSDGTLKKNIVNIKEKNSDYMSRLMKLNGKFYEKQIYSKEANAKEIDEMVASGKVKKENSIAALDALNKNRKETYKKEFGFIAQEVEQVFPELVEKSNDGIYAINYTGLIPVMLEAIKELQTKVVELESQQTKSVSTLKSTEQSIGDNDITATTEYLSQNKPNPVNGMAEISYSLPEGTRSANIIFYSTNGSIVKNVNLNASNKTGNITISSSEFSSGLYVYKLVANGIVLDTKKMISK